MASKKKLGVPRQYLQVPIKQFDDLAPYGNLPSASIYGSKKPKTPGGERRYANGKGRKKKVKK